MNLKSLVVPVVLLLSMPSLADDTKITSVAIDQAAAAVAADDPQEAEQKPEKTNETPAGKTESLGESSKEMKKALEILSKLKLSGYIQAQYVNDERSSDQLASPTSTRNFDQFSVRRGRVKVVYQATPSSRFVLQPDISTSGVALTDGYLELSEPWTKWKHTLTAGQFSWPFGFEIMYSSSKREVPERSRVMRALFAGQRDRGVMLSGLGLGDRLSYRIAVVNGTGTSQSFDFNEHKDIVGRLGYSFGALDIGGSIYRGEDLVATSSNANGREFDKERMGVDFQWTTPIQGLGIRGEYITGKQAPTSGTARSESHDVEGWYFYAMQNVGTRHQFIVRLDEYDADTDVANNAVRAINPAYIFRWDANSTVMLSYEMIDNEIDDPDDNVFTLRYQFSF